MLGGYEPGGFHDECFASDGTPRPHARVLVDRIGAMSPEEVRRRQGRAEVALRNMGITFNVYGAGEGRERIFPFDLVPRVVDGAEWVGIEDGLRQRVRALNMFIDDVYHDQDIVDAGVVPREVVESSEGFLPKCVGLDPPKGVWCHIVGTDLVRHRDGRMYVLEDNLRVPSGVSYVLENRHVMKQVFPEVFQESRVFPVETYPMRLLELLHHVAPRPEPTMVVLTPGTHNAAYFEHSYLAQKMGVELVEGRDLVVEDGIVKMRTTKGLQRVDVIYRRMDDDFLDPLAFRPDSMLGVPGLFDAYRKGRVALVNAPGTGVADDKVVYTYVPDMVRFYLDEEPILPNVPTYRCIDERDRAFVLENLDKLVVKAANGSGGYGMLVGPHASEAERADFAKRVEADPRSYVAQPTLALSRVPTLVGESFEGRHVDLRPYILHGEDIFVLPGGLTRVALRKGSLVVNSSQGGGSKDTWVVAPGSGGSAPRGGV